MLGCRRLNQLAKPFTVVMMFKRMGMWKQEKVSAVGGGGKGMGKGVGERRSDRG